MLFGVIYEADDKKQYRLSFSSDVASYHFKIGETISKAELKDLIEHVTSDCEMFNGNARIHHDKNNITQPSKKRCQFILSRILERKKIEDEKNEYKINLDDVCERNEKTIAKMLESTSENFKIIQSLSLPSSDLVDDFYGKMKKDQTIEQEIEKNTKITK